MPAYSDANSPQLQLLGLLSESTEDIALFTFEPDGKITSWNRGAAALFGYDSVEAIGMNVASLYSLEDQAQGVPQAEMEGARRLGRLREDRPHVRKDGTEFFAGGFMFPLRDSAGSPIGFGKIARDITDRINHHDQVEKSRDLYRSMLDKIDDGFCIIQLMYDGDGNPVDYRFAECNQAFETHTGLHDVQGKTALQVVPNLERHWVETYADVATRSKPLRFTDYSEPMERWFDVFATPIGPSSDHMVAILFRDITEKRRAEEETSTLRELLSTELEAMQNLHTLSTRLVGTTDSAAMLDEILNAVLGMQQADKGNIQMYRPEVNLLEIVAAKGFASAFLEQLRHLSPGTDTTSCAVAAVKGERIIIPDTETTDWFAPYRDLTRQEEVRAAQSTPIFSRTGQLLGMLTTYFRDPHVPSDRDLRLTDLYIRMAAELLERQRTEDELRDREAQYRAIFENTSVGMAQSNASTGLLERVNDTLCRMLGYREEELVGQSCLSYVLVDEGADDDLQLKRLYRGEIDVYQGELQLLAKGGNRVWTHLTVNLVRDTSGKPMRTVSVIMDVSARKAAEQEVSELNQRLHRTVFESSHRIKNHLQVLAASAETSLPSEGSTVPIEAVHRLITQTRMLAQIHDLLTKETKVDAEIQTVDLPELLEKIMGAMPQTKERSVTFRIDELEVPVRTATTLALIVNELVSNAIKHGRNRVDVEFSANGANGVLEVTDDGPGFPPGFDAHRAANTGLELLDTLVRHDLRGKVDFSNSPQGGACVQVTFGLPN